MFVVIVIVIILGFLAYSLLWPDPEKQDFKDERHVLVYLVKIVYRSLRFTQGVLKLGNELIYRAGAGAGQSALRIIPTNHKVVLTGIRYVIFTYSIHL